MKEMSKSQKKLIVHLIVGFLVGAGIGNLIAFLISLLTGGNAEAHHIVAMQLTAKIGLVGAIVLQTFLCGLFGMGSIGGMLLYQIDNWSLAKATIVHYVLIVTCYVGCSLILYWFPPEFVYYAISVGAMTVGFFIIWLCMYLVWKKEVRKMNEELNEYKKEQTKNE